MGRQSPLLSVPFQSEVLLFLLLLAVATRHETFQAANFYSKLNTMPTSYSPIGARLFLPILIVLCLFGLHCRVIQESVRENFRDDLRKGRDLSSDEAELLEEKLAADPKDITSRTQLLGHYQKRRLDQDESALAAIRRHLLWLIRNSPDAAVLGSPEGGISRNADPEGYSEGRKAWMNHLQRDPDNVTFLDHAARFLLFDEQKTRIELLQRARSLDPSNAEWPERLGREHRANIFKGSESTRKEAAEKALEFYEDAFELSDEHGRETLLEDLAKVAFEAGQHDKARQYAESLLQGAGDGMSWNYGNRVHHGNLVLGRIALAEGNIKAARFRLVAATNTKGSPGLKSFGPNMTLAKDFLERGERDVVLKYFRLCSRFWEMDRGRLDEWTSKVKEGKIPDFGANLRY